MLQKFCPYLVHFRDAVSICLDFTNAKLKNYFLLAFLDGILTSSEESDEENSTTKEEEERNVDFNSGILQSKELDQEMISVPSLQSESERIFREADAKRDKVIDRSEALNDLCWWQGISSRYKLQNLPPPPKLISSGRNGLSKMHNSRSPEHHAVITMSQRHHFPLTANGYGVVNFHDHRISAIADSIPVRASLDGLREVSLNLRHASEIHHRESSLCPNIPQPTPSPQFNNNHFFIHSHPFLTAHQQQECLSNLQSKEQDKASEGEETKYKCEICNSSFTLQRLLNRHMKTHSFYKRYHCQFCTKGFNDTFDLKRHIRTHTGIKPFKCSRCDKSFTQRCSLEAHLTRVHGIVHKFGFRERRSKLFVCEDCGSTFTENADFMKHLHEFHPETEKIIRARRNGGFPPKLKAGS